MTTVRLDTRELDRIAKGLNRKRDKIVEGLAFEVERDAKIKAPYITGALEGSIYTRTKKGGTRPKKMKGHNYVELPKPSGKIIAVVGSGIEYAAYVEFGHHTRGGSFVAARPYLGPAVEGKARKLNDGSTWRELFT